MKVCAWKAVIVTSVALLMFCDSALAIPIKQGIKNKFSEAADDLQITFTGPVSEPKFTRFNGAQVNPSTVSATSAEWTTSTLGDTVAGSNSAERFITFDGASGTRIDPAKSHWTKNGVELANSFAAVGQAPSLQFGETGAVARFINPEPVEVIYSNIRLFKDNDIDRFNLSQFDTATGVLVSGLPTAVSLLPGESLSLPFGSFDPTKYELALANVAVASSPGDQFGVGAGAVAPEPATLLLFGTTAAGLGLVRWRQRRRKQQP
jgi:hypothetical protein